MATRSEGPEMPDCLAITDEKQAQVHAILARLPDSGWRGMSPPEERTPVMWDLVEAIVGIGRHAGDGMLAMDIGMALAGQRGGRRTGLTLVDWYWAKRVMDLYPGWEADAQARLTETATALAEAQACLDKHFSRDLFDDHGNFIGTEEEFEQRLREADAIRAVIQEREHEHDLAGGHLSNMKEAERVLEVCV